MDFPRSTHTINTYNGLCEGIDDLVMDGDSSMINAYQTMKELLVNCQNIEHINESLEIKLQMKDKTLTDVKQQLSHTEIQLNDARTQIKVFYRKNKELEEKLKKLLGFVELLQKATSEEMCSDALNLLSKTDLKPLRRASSLENEISYGSILFDTTGGSLEDNQISNYGQYSSIDKKVSFKKRSSSTHPTVNFVPRKLSDCEESKEENILTIPKLANKPHVNEEDNNESKLLLKRKNTTGENSKKSSKSKHRRSRSETTIYTSKGINLPEGSDEIETTHMDVKSFASLNSTVMSNAWATDLISISTRSHTFEKIPLSMGCCDCCRGFIIRFKTMFRCRDCKIVCHNECKNKAPSLCLLRNAPYKFGSNFTPILSEVAPKRFPCIPYIVIHCVLALEKFSLVREGLYQVKGSDSETKKLYNALLCNRIIPSFMQVEPETITECLKKFLNNLRDPVIPRLSRKDFIDAVNNEDGETLTYFISDLPDPNLHTLSYLCIHWLKVAENSQQNKMTIENIARSVGPVIVSYSRPLKYMTKTEIENETDSVYRVMLALLQLPESYWIKFVTNKSVNERSKAPIAVVNSFRRKGTYKSQM